MHIILKQVCNCSTLLLLSAVINPAESMFLLQSSLFTATCDHEALQANTAVLEVVFLWLAHGCQLAVGFYT